MPSCWPRLHLDRCWGCWECELSAMLMLTGWPGYVKLSVSCSLAAATRASISASNCLSGGIKLLALGIAYNNKDNKNMRPIKVTYVKIFQNGYKWKAGSKKTWKYFWLSFLLFLDKFCAHVLTTAACVCLSYHMLKHPLPIHLVEDICLHSTSTRQVCSSHHQIVIGISSDSVFVKLNQNLNKYCYRQ